MAETIAPTTSQKLTAEAIGTFTLVFFGCGSVVYAGQVGAPTTVTTVGLTFGLVVTVMAYAFGRVSGAHFNPAVSVGAALSGRLAWSQVGLYVVAQLAGAIVGGAALFGLLKGFEDFDADGNMGQNSFGDEGTGYALWAALVLELLLTAVFLYVILAVTDERNEHPAFAPLAIGLTLAAIHFVAIPATGTSVNPARSIGPALFAGTDAITQQWLFIVAPLLGAALAGLTYPILFGRGAEPVPGSGLNLSRPALAPAAVPGYGAPDQYQQQWNQQDPAYQAQAAQGAAQAQTAQTPQTAGQTSGQAGQQWGAEPIIQDGWQWDPVAQQWIPAPQPPLHQPPAAQQWPSEPGAQTQIRPPEGL